VAEEPAAAVAPEPDAPAAAAGPGAAATGREEEPEGTVVEGLVDREFIVETGAYAVRFGTRGGRIVSWRLLKYVDELDVPIDIIPRTLGQIEDYPLRLLLDGEEAGAARLDDAIFREEVREAGPADEWPGEGFEGKVVSFTYADGRGLEARKEVALPADGYIGQVRVELRRNGADIPFSFTWAVGLPQPSDDKTTAYFAAEGQGLIEVGGSIQREAADEVSSPMAFRAGPGGARIDWGGLESTYFASLLLPERPEEGSLTFVPHGPVREPGSDDEEMLLAARFSGRGPLRFESIVGPKDYDLLASLGRGLERAINFSRFAILYAITKYLFLALRWINGFVGNYGFSIVILTVVIRAAFFPVTYRSMITMRQNAKKMQKIQPRVKQIQERYRKMKKTVETQRRQNEETMAVYKKEGLNPMGSLGGCLPLLLQMPVFIGFYNLLSVTIEMRGAPFILWVQDLSRMDPYYVFPVLMGLTWMVQQWMTSSSIPDPMQRKLMGAMPVIFTFMMARMASGLVIYWFVSNLLGLVQQWLINRQADRPGAKA
jgi:YidC/Oxa1 family membrane protein insertase